MEDARNPKKKAKDVISRNRTLASAMELLKQRRAFLLKAIELKEKQLKRAPEGTLRISNSNGREQYYHRIDSKDKCGNYIPQRKIKLVHGLAQKTEDKKELPLLKRELAFIDEFFKKYPMPAESVYEGLSEERKKLVLPLEESNDEFVKRWLAQEFVPHPVPPMDNSLVTENGDVVRSRAELILINDAIQMGIPNFYEKPLYLAGEGTVYPDMTGLCVRERVEKYVEYFGMMHDPEYAARAVHKINCYEKNGIYLGERLIAIFEAEGEPLNTRHVKDLLRKHFL